MVSFQPATWESTGMGADPPGASEKIPIIRAGWWYTYPSEKI